MRIAFPTELFKQGGHDWNMKIASINICDYGSTGKIMLQTAECARQYGNTVRTYSRKWKNQATPPLGHTYFGSFAENALHHILGYVSGFPECFSYIGTKKLTEELRELEPDIIHLHNLHGWYIDLPLLFRFIKKYDIPVVWTLHDCWSFTGHCPYFTAADCDKWKTGCHHCPQYREYPASLADRTKTMWNLKKSWFTNVNDLTIVTPSDWLAELVAESYLKDYPLRVIRNGIDLSVFKPTESDFRRKYHCEDRMILLGVASEWSKRKGLDSFIRLSERLDDRYQIVLVGTDDAADRLLPDSIISIHKTTDQTELAGIYSSADLFVNPTAEDNYPTVNMEALACGTPVLTFRTGGSGEIIDETCGSAVDSGDIDALEREINRICTERPYSAEACLKRAASFNSVDRYKEYVKLYSEICEK